MGTKRTGILTALLCMAIIVAAQATPVTSSTSGYQRVVVPANHFKMIEPAFDVGTGGVIMLDEILEPNGASISWQTFLTEGNEDASTKVEDSLYYIREWKAPAASPGTDFVPVVPMHYGNSKTYAISQFTSGNPEAFGVETPFDTPIAIPEPTVAAFIGIFGGAMLIARRFFSKSRETA
jgi:hypothetical protein